jgi:pyrroloquinoline quinone biosynthesis protein E
MGSVVDTDRVPVNWDEIRPRLRAGVRLVYDDVRGRMALLHPEGVALLNATAGATLALMDGRISVGGIAAELSDRFRGVRNEEVWELLGGLEEARLVEVGPYDAGRLMLAEKAPADVPGQGTGSTSGTSGRANRDVTAPLGLLAELTHRCPLHCPYCSNPLQLAAAAEELPTSAWLDILDQARRLGVLQAHLSGGEPLLRRDLEVLAAGARSLGMYVNLVTSGLGLSGDRALALADAGVDHVQLSVQGAVPEIADRVAGTKAHRRKLEAAAAVRAAGMVLTVNVVLHRGNVADIDGLVTLAADLKADRLELAHAQYYGWALRNRAALLPSAEQVRRAEEMVRIARDHYPQLMIVYVVSDYYETVPKPCMNGWGSRQLTVTPNGTVLPCPAATVIPDLRPPRIGDMPLERIWTESAAFTRFRGTSWLPDPCRSCPARNADFGGCRCQAYQLLGDAGATDPVCQYSPRHQVIGTAIAAAGATPPKPLIYRTAARPARESALGTKARTYAAPAIREERHISLASSRPANSQQTEGTQAEI